MELNSVQGSYRIQEPTFSGPDKFYDIMLLVNGPPELVNIEEGGWTCPCWTHSNKGWSECASPQKPVPHPLSLLSIVSKCLLGYSVRKEGRADQRGMQT